MSLVNKSKKRKEENEPYWIFLDERNLIRTTIEQIGYELMFTQHIHTYRLIYAKNK